MIAFSTAQLIEAAQSGLAPGQCNQDVRHGAEVEAHERADPRLFDQKGVRIYRQGSDELQLVGAEAKAVAVILGARTRVGSEDLGGRLFDDCRGYIALERVAGTVRAEAYDCIAFAEGFHPVADASGEHFIVERLPTLVDEDHDGVAVEPLFNPMEQIHQWLEYAAPAGPAARSCQSRVLPR